MSNEFPPTASTSANAATVNTVANREPLPSLEEFGRTLRARRSLRDGVFVDLYPVVRRAVRDADGRAVASLSVAFPRTTSPEHTIPGVARLVVEAARRLSESLGCPAASLPSLGRDLHAA